MTNNNPVILVDGSSYLFRAYHAMPPLTNNQGQATGAIYGVINMLRKLQQDYPDSPIVVVFDPKGKTFRHALYADYKANRPPMPDDLRSQIEPLFAIIKAQGLPLIIIDGVEADDVIGTLAKQASQQQHSTIISTGDKDMAQLVSDHVCLVNTMTGKQLDRQGVIEKFGVAPEQIIDYLALMGDSVDNIPGIPKVGPKTAAKWLNEYGDVATLVENADAIGGKIGENLRNHLAQLPLSQQLTTIKCDVALDFSITDLSHQAIDTAALQDWYQRLEFKTWLKELSKQDTPNPTDNTKHYTIILDDSTWQHWLNKLQAAKQFTFDCETTSLQIQTAELVGLAFCIDNDSAYLPLAHRYEDAPKQLDRSTILSQLTPLFEDAMIKKIGQNLKYDINVLKNYGINVQGASFDTMLESYVLNATASRHDMDSLALTYLGRQTIHYEDIAGKGKKQRRFDEIDLAEAGPYAAEDADVTQALHDCLWPQINADEALHHVYTHIEMPLMPVLARMEYHGVLIDSDLLLQQSQRMATRITQLEQEAYDLAGCEFNLASPKQLGQVLFEQLKLPILKKTPTGTASTSEEVMTELAQDFALPKLILEYRQLAKLKSTYTDRLPEQIEATTQRVHTSYHQAVTATGRLSSSNPNLQNIPIRSEAGRAIRQAFIAPKGYQLLAADYSQIELRIMAHLSNDNGLLTAFAHGLDIHKATAAEVFGIELDAVSFEQRRHAKAINFGLIYGMSSFGLARQLGISRDQAQAYMDLYFTRYPGVKQYMAQTRDLAHQQGYVETLSGRRLYLPEINARNKMRQKAAERAAINAPMQGTAADIIKQAMITMDTFLQDNYPSVHMIMQVHDELVFEVPHDDIDTITPQIKTIMENAMQLHVPLIVAIGSGDNWDQAH